MKNFYEFNDLTLINLDEIMYIEIDVHNESDRKLIITMNNNKVFIVEERDLDIDNLYDEIKENVLN